MQILVSDSPSDLATDAADHLAGLLSRGPQTLGLAGGSTPVETYRILRERDLPWEQVSCWLPDERWVPAHDAASNALMARTELTDHVSATLLSPDTALESPAEAAAVYQLQLEAVFGNAPGIVLLGMGADGHTASLFPDTAALGVDEPGYVANWIESLRTWRLTATAPLLSAATRLVFLVAGSAKAQVLRSILIDGEPYPAGLVAAGAQDVTWLLDAEAAADL